MASPMPLLAPVTSARVPFNPRSMASPWPLCATRANTALVGGVRGVLRRPAHEGALRDVADSIRGCRGDDREVPRRPGFVGETGGASMGFVTAHDGADIYFKDWGVGQPIVLSHGWPLNCRQLGGRRCCSWPSHGYRCVAHDRRGHGRSSQTWHGNEMNTYADDLAAAHRAARPARMWCWSGSPPGGGEVARYVGRHGIASRGQGRAGLGRHPRSCCGPHDNPGGVPVRGVRRASVPPRSPTGPSCTGSSPTARSSVTTALAPRCPRVSATRSGLQGMQSGHRNALECITAFSETDFRADLQPFDVPTLVIHGDDDQIVPFSVGGQASAALVNELDARRLRGRPARAHRHAPERLGDDLLAFVTSSGR